jgi:hypothetical protein
MDAWPGSAGQPSPYPIPNSRSWGQGVDGETFPQASTGPIPLDLRLVSGTTSRPNLGICRIALISEWSRESERHRRREYRGQANLEASRGSWPAARGPTFQPLKTMSLILVMDLNHGPQQGRNTSGAIRAAGHRFKSRSSMGILNTDLAKASSCRPPNFSKSHSQERRQCILIRMLSLFLLTKMVARS